MDSITRRVRSSNYSYKEVEILIRNLEARLEFLSSMGDPKTTCLQNEVWEEIALEISKAGGQCYRTGRDVKRKWHDLKSRVKFKALKIQAHLKKFGDTSSCPLSLDPLQKRVVALFKFCTNDSSLLSLSVSEHEPVSVSACPIYVSSYIATTDNKITNADSNTTEAEMHYNSQPVLLIPVVMDNKQSDPCLEESDDKLKGANSIIETEVPLRNAEVSEMNDENSLESGLEEGYDSTEEAKPMIKTTVALSNAEVPHSDVENFHQIGNSRSKKRKLSSLDDDVLADVHDMFMELTEVQVQQTTEIGEMKDILLKLVKLEEAKLRMKCSKFDLNFEALID